MSCVFAVSAQTHNALDVLKTRDLGKYETAVSVTVDILPYMANALTELISKSGRSVDPTESDGMLDIIMAFMPVTRNVLSAVAKTEGRTVPKEELERLDRIGKNLPSVFKFMHKLHTTDFHGIDELPSGSTSKTSSDTQFSGSFVQMPHGRNYYVHHGK